MASILENVNVISSIELAKQVKSKSIKTKPNTFAKTKQYWYANKIVSTPAEEEKKEEQVQIIEEKPVETKVEETINGVKEEAETTTKDQSVVKEEHADIEKKLGNKELLIKIDTEDKIKKGLYRPIKLKNIMFDNVNKNAIKLKNNEESVEPKEELQATEEKIEISPEKVQEEVIQTEINREFDNASAEVVEAKEEPVEKIIAEEKAETQLRDEIQIAPDRPQEYKEIVDASFAENEVKNISSEEVEKIIAENKGEDAFNNSIRVSKNQQHLLKIDNQEEESEIERLVNETLEKLKRRNEELESKDKITNEVSKNIYSEDVKDTNYLDTFNKMTDLEALEAEKIITEKLKQINRKKEERNLEDIVSAAIKEEQNQMNTNDKVSRLEEMMNKFRTKQSLKETLSNSISEIQQRELVAQTELEEKRNKFQQAELEFEKRLQELDEEIEKYQSLIDDSNRKLEDLSRQSQYEQEKLEALYAAIGSLA